MKNIGQYRALIVDVDGTLYFQPKLRLIMAAKLALHVLLHPGRRSDLKIIKTFRHLREEITTFDGDLETYQYQIVADQLGLDLGVIRSVIEKWMYRAPLPYLRSCRDPQLITLLTQAKASGATLIAYSDYPAVEKLAALGLTVDHTYSATDPTINCLKPDPKGLQAILGQLALSPQNCLFIGDRDEKDGLCARSVGMDFLILPKSATARAQLYQALR